jgi:hypothetical protein
MGFPMMIDKLQDLLKTVIGYSTAVISVLAVI